jgi:glucose/arabinose dehydrogenase
MFAMPGRSPRPVPAASRGPVTISVLLLLSLLLPPVARAATVVPPNFAVDDAAPGANFVVPTAMAFRPDGSFLVTEKRGRVYEVRGGVKQANPVWNGEAEVLDQHDRGLLGIAVDPNYFVNHFIYLLYTVDPDSNNTDTNDDAFGRLTRYQVGFADSSVVVPGSRTILMGYNWTNGPVSASPSHTVGALDWGRDGSLLVSVGDGAQYDFADGGGSSGDAGAFGNGRTDPYENIGAFRSQDITSLCGKILRINPATGHGYASNPFANGNLASVQSRVYAYGLRNPFRFGVRPNSGVADTSAGNPGSVYIGDVGWNSFEEMDVARTGGKNFGWPCYEGLTGNGPYQALNPPHNGCSSFGTASNPSSASAPTMP